MKCLKLYSVCHAKISSTSTVDRAYGDTAKSTPIVSSRSRREVDKLNMRMKKNVKRQDLPLIVSTIKSPAKSAKTRRKDRWKIRFRKKQHSNRRDWVWIIRSSNSRSNLKYRKTKSMMKNKKNRKICISSPDLWTWDRARLLLNAKPNSRLRWLSTMNLRTQLSANNKSSI